MYSYSYFIYFIEPVCKDLSAIDIAIDWIFLFDCDWDWVWVYIWAWPGATCNDLFEANVTIGFGSIYDLC